MQKLDPSGPEGKKLLFSCSDDLNRLILLSKINGLKVPVSSAFMH